MSSNESKIFERYSLGKKEEGRATLSRSSSLEFHYTKKHLEGLIKKTDRVLEIGCGTGYYGFYYADKCQEYLGIDIVPDHIDLFEQKIAESQITNISCQIGDATDLKHINDESFNVVLCLGPMYHLPPNERELVFAECKRVCKTDGIIAFAYINKIGVYAGACIIDDHYPNEQANKCVIENGTDDMRPDLFFYTTPEEMNTTAIKYGLKKIKNLGTDFFITMNIVNAMSDEEFQFMRPLYDLMTSYESCTGMSNHALLICKKQV
jgi:ubiquinone/menaquinone biosynthesis C-methylase UbiE